MNLIQMGQTYKNDAMQGMGQASQLEEQRKQVGKQIDMAESEAKKSNAAMGAGIGMMAGGPVGALAGAAIGYLASDLF